MIAYQVVTVSISCWIFCLGFDIVLLAQQWSQILPCKRCWVMRDFLRCTTGNYGTAALPAFGARVDDMVGALDNLKIMLNDNHTIAAHYEALENLEQLLDVSGVQAGGRLIENIECLASRAPA